MIGWTARFLGMVKPGDDVDFRVDRVGVDLGAEVLEVSARIGSDLVMAATARLSAPNPLASSTRLGEIADWLLAPASAGFLLTRDDLRAIAVALDIPAGFAERRTLLMDMLRAAGESDALPALLNALDARVAQAGFDQYEVSVYARDGRRCAHNLNYWTFGDYLGIGAGAHGKLTLPTLPAEGRVLRRWKQKLPKAYMANAGKPEAVDGEETLATHRLPFDFMLNALRLNDGVSIASFEARTGLSRSVLDDRLAIARERGWLTDEPDWLRPTPLGLRFANDVIGLFLD